jgi:hypothetical protein
MHQVTALEVLQTDRYTFLKVKENLDEFWIATANFEAKVGKEYFYQGGLLKTDFESIDLKRNFDKIYLVSSIIDSEQHPSSHNHTEMENNSTDEMGNSSMQMAKNPKAIALSELLKNKTKYQGKSIIVSGKIAKANYGIMEKNWYHLQDETSLNGTKCDLTITSQDNIMLGSTVNIEGIFYLDKDFGSGYSYAVIMEEASLKLD